MDAHIEDLHRDLGLPKLQQRRILHSACLCFNNIFLNSYVSLAHIYVPVLPVAGHITWPITKRTLNVPRRKINMGKRGISMRGTVFWNSLPDDPSIVKTFNSFKRQLKLRILEISENHPI